MHVDVRGQPVELVLSSGMCVPGIEFWVGSKCFFFTFEPSNQPLKYCQLHLYCSMTVPEPKISCIPLKHISQCCCWSFLLFYFLN